MPNTILIVDDDPDFSMLLAKYLRSKGFEVTIAATAKEGVESAKRSAPDVALVDVKLPDQSGVDLIDTFKSIDESIPIIMVSCLGDPKLVVDALQFGAGDYVQKPVDNEELLEKIGRALELRSGSTLEKELGGEGLLIGESFQTKKLIREISKIANSDAPVLLRGESGTGKTLVAEIIHSHSPRRDRPFVTINCPAIPEHLLESELFGHEKGAFTGAIRDKIGKFELAKGGTVFLDEIGDLPSELQVKILRVLQGHEYERVGGLKTIHVDVRIIAATNRDLEHAISDNRFREDLFYRLNVLPLYVPALRERKEDIPLLAEYFLRYYNRKSNKHFKSIPEKVMKKLIDHPWYGNVRELQNVIERAVVLGRGPQINISNIAMSNVPQRSAAPAEEKESASLKEIEYKALLKALEESGGNISRAAKTLGIGRDTVYRRLKKHKIQLKR